MKVARGRFEGSFFITVLDAPMPFIEALSRSEDDM